MSDSLKNDWKETGTNLGHAFRDLAKTIVKTGAKGVRKAENWANEDGTQPSEQPTEENEKK